MDKKKFLIGFVVLLIVIIAVAFYKFQPWSRQPKSLITIKVAVLLPLTGPQSGIGQGCANSVKLAFNEAEGTLTSESVHVEFSLLDDGSKTETAIAAAQRAISDSDIVLAIAHFNSPCALATVDLFHEGGMPMIVPAAVNSGITAKGYQEVFRTCNTDVQQAAYMAKFLVDTKKANSIYTIHDSSAFGKGLVDALKKELAGMGITLTGEDAFKVGDIDFSAVIERVEAVSPDIIVLGCMATEGALLRRQMIEKRAEIPVIGFSGIFYDTFLTNAGTAAESIMAIYPLPPLEKLPGGKSYQESYEAAGFDAPYESAGPFGYVAGQVAAAVLSKGDFTRTGLIKTLHTSQFATAFGPLTFAENGEMNLKMFCFYEVHNGEWVPIYNVTSDGTIIPMVNP